MGTREILIHSVSPCCPIEAFVEDDGKTCYFYLWRDRGKEKPAVSSCFVCNRTDQSQSVSLKEWKKNPVEAPILPYDKVTLAASANGRRVLPGGYT